MELSGKVKELLQGYGFKIFPSTNNGKCRVTFDRTIPSSYISITERYEFDGSYDGFIEEVRRRVRDFNMVSEIRGMMSASGLDNETEDILDHPEFEYFYRAARWYKDVLRMLCGGFQAGRKVKLCYSEHIGTIIEVHPEMQTIVVEIPESGKFIFNAGNNINQLVVLPEDCNGNSLELANKIMDKFYSHGRKSMNYHV